VTGSSADLAIIVSGPDLRQLRQYGQQALAILKATPGAADSAIEQELDQPQLRIELDRQALARFALNVQDVQDLIELAVGGRAVSVKLEGERRFDITVRYRPEARQDIAALRGMLIHTPDGGRVPLSELAVIRVAGGATIVARRDNQRQITVRTNIRGRDQGGFVAEAQRRFARDVALKNGYHVHWGGQFENLDRAQRRMKWILPFTILIIFGLLYWAFGSARVSGLVLLNVPFSIAGGILMLLARNINLSVSAAVGFISLFGVAVMSGVLFVSEMKRQLARSDAPLHTVALDAAAAQLRPFLMLITVALLGMLPAALARGIGSDIQRPMASVIVGGLLSTLFFGLFVVPVSFYLMCRRYGRSSLGHAQGAGEHLSHD
jgi:heavy metal efflux system protein